MGPLRTHLQAVTAGHHRDTEALFDRFDMQSVSGLGGFLRAHAAALDAVVAAANRNAATGLSESIHPLRNAVTIDLATLGEIEKIPEIRFPDEKWHSAGVTYVIAGSRLGATVLTRRLASARDESIRTAQQYLRCPEGDRLWLDFKMLDQASSFKQDESDAAAHAAIATFECFAAAATRVLNG